ncbi:MAG: elongation factor G [Calditrichaeota bacterium]|nr:MAG: elongation factor G [Calditrichota bacterium]
MKVYKTEQIRNIGIFGHGSVGKSMLSEALQLDLGNITRMGTIEQGTTVSDYNIDEVERHISINTSLMHGEWRDHKINIIDTPGYPDFYGEVVGAMRVIDTVFLVVSAKSGVEVGSELVWHRAEKDDIPRVIILNKLDQENIDFDAVYQGLTEDFNDRVVLAQFPVNPGPGFNQIVDLIRMKLLTFKTDGSGAFSEEEIPAELKEKADELHLKLVEAVAESDDSLMEKYFESGLDEDDFRKGLKEAMAHDLVYPVFCVSATENIGVKRLLDIVVNFCPAPNELKSVKTADGNEIELTTSAPFSALIFKTMGEQHMGELSFIKVFSGVLKTGEEVLNTSRDVTERITQIFTLNGKQKDAVESVNAGDIAALVKLKNTHTGDSLSDKGAGIKFPVIEFPEPRIREAIRPKSKGDEDKIGNGLHTLHEEDPTFMYHNDAELHQTIISGQGEMHLATILSRLKHRFGVEVDEEEPRIPYRETIRKKAEAQGKFKKQSGGRGQYGDCHLRLEPLERGAQFEFVDAIVGGVIPGKFIPAVEKGVVETMEKGVLAGYPVVDVKVTVYDGSYHNVDSSEMAFKVAASMAFKAAFEKASPVLLEPIYEIEVRVPDEYMGDVMGDISSRRGRILGMDSEGKFQIVKAAVPLAELYKYSTALRSMTQGRGIHSRQFLGYEEVPADAASKIIEEAKNREDE